MDDATNGVGPPVAAIGLMVVDTGLRTVVGAPTEFMVSETDTGLRTVVGAPTGANDDIPTKCI